MKELQGEVTKISREIEAANEEQSTFLAYDKRVKELAVELTGKLELLCQVYRTVYKVLCFFFSLTESQGILADYNLMMDKLNTDTERVEIEAEAEEVRAANASEAAEIENLFAEKQQREKVGETYY